MYLARELTDHSLPEIGRGIGGRNHSTVVHAVNRVECRRPHRRRCPHRRRQPAQTSSAGPLDGRPCCDNQQPPASHRREPLQAGSTRLSTYRQAQLLRVQVGRSLKLTVSRETFLAQLGVAVRGASTRSAIQTLAGVLIRVEEGSRRAPGHGHGARPARLARADESTPGQGGGPRPPAARRGAIAAQGRRSRSSTAARSRTSRSCRARRSFHLRTLPQEDFPKLPEPPTDGVLRVPAAAFVDTIARVARAASRDETRPHLTGVLVTASGARAAHGRHRLLSALRVKETTLAEALDGSLEANVPARTLQELGRIARRRRLGRRSASPRSRTRSSSPSDDVVLSSRLGRGPLPQLPAAASRLLRARAAGEPRGAARGGAPRRACSRRRTLRCACASPRVRWTSRRRRRTWARPASRCRCRSTARRSRSASTRSSSGTGSRARSRTSSTLKLISPLRPGLIESGDEGAGFRLPRDADPPERVGARDVRVARVELRDFRNYERAEVELADGPDRDQRAQRRRQDEPARGRLLRLHGALAADLQRARAGAPRRIGWPASRSTSRATRTAPLEVGFEPGEPSACAWTAAPVEGPPARRAAARERLPARAPRAGQGRAGAARRAHLDQLVAALWPARAPARARATRARSRSATRCWRASAPAAPARTRSTPGTRSWRVRGSQLMEDRREAVDGLAAALRGPRRATRAARGGRAALPPALAPPARAGARRPSWPSAARRPRARLHRPRSAPRRAAAAARRRRLCAPTARRASSAWPCSPSCSPSASCSPTRRGRAPLMLLDDVMSELDADRRELLAELLARRRPGGGHRHRARARARRARRAR